MSPTIGYHTMRFAVALLASLSGVTSLFAIHNVELPVEVTSTSGTLTNHTVRIELNNNTPDFEWSNSCNDISVVNSASNELPLFIEKCDTQNRQATIWVLVSSVPPSPATTRITLRYGDPSASSSSNATATFTDSGFLYHTQPYRNGSPGPQMRSEADSLFNYGSVTTAGGYGCTQLTSPNVDNSSVFGSNSNIGYHLLTVMVVRNAGDYEFRYGSDFGAGGELAIDNTPLEASWTDDLWWGFNYTHPDVLLGSRSLSVGDHTLEALGFEGCCDGPAGFQYRRLPLGTWTAMTTGSSNFTLLAPDCPIEQSQILNGERKTRVGLSITKTVSHINATLGQTVTFTLQITNNGPFSATDFTVTDEIKSGFTSVSNISHSGILSGGQVNWTIASLASGKSMLITFDAVVN